MTLMAVTPRVSDDWIVDPAEPSITAYNLEAGTYVEAGSASGDSPVTLERPFPVTVAPAALIDI